MPIMESIWDSHEESRNIFIDLSIFYCYILIKNLDEEVNDALTKFVEDAH